MTAVCGSSLLVAAVLVVATVGQTEFRFSNTHSSHMVLQSAPQQANVWGYCEPGDAVIISLIPSDGDEYAKQTVVAVISEYLGNSTWMATLPATPSSMTASYTVTASSKTAGATVTLKNVLFGDVRTQH